MGEVLWLKIMEGDRKIIGHGYVTGILVIISVGRESTISGTSPVDRNGVQFFECLDEMVGVWYRVSKARSYE